MGRAPPRRPEALRASHPRGAQAGLAWITILRKREGYRAALRRLHPDKVADYGKRKIQSLLLDPGIVRNRAKVFGTVQNARAFAKLRDEFGSFDQPPLELRGGQAPEEPSGLHGKRSRRRPEESRAMSKDLKKRGFAWVNTTICYAFMQAAGLVTDQRRHLLSLRGAAAQALRAGIAMLHIPLLPKEPPLPEPGGREGHALPHEGAEWPRSARPTRDCCGVDLLRAREGNPRPLLDFTTPQLFANTAAAARHFMQDALPLGDTSQLPDDYVSRSPASTELPHVMVRRNMQKIEGVLARMPEMLAGLTRNIDPRAAGPRRRRGGRTCVELRPPRGGPRRGAAQQLAGILH